MVSTAIITKSRAASHLSMETVAPTPAPAITDPINHETFADEGPLVASIIIDRSPMESQLSMETVALTIAPTIADPTNHQMFSDIEPLVPSIIVDRNPSSSHLNRETIAPVIVPTIADPTNHETFADRGPLVPSIIIDRSPTASRLNNEAITLTIAQIITDSTNPQTLAGIGAMLLPEQFQVAGGVLIHQVVSLFCTEVLGIVFSQGASFNTQGIVLAQIQKEIKKLHKKVDKILGQPLKNAIKALKHAINYLENKEFYQKAYEEFQKVLDNSTTAFDYLDNIEDKVVCKRLSMFARLMVNSYHKRENEFVPLASLPVSTKKIIAEDIKIDVDDLLDAFYTIKVTYSTILARKSNTGQIQNQQTLDPLLRACLPIIWTVLSQETTGSEIESLLRYVPEGIEDASKITAGNSYFMLWKDLCPNGNFQLKWSPLICADFNALNGHLARETTYSPFQFEENDLPYHIKDGKENAREVKIDRFKNSFSVWTKNQELNAKYNGSFSGLDFTNLDILRCLILAPSSIRYHCHDNLGWLIAHRVVIRGYSELVKYFLNQENSICGIYKEYIFESSTSEYCGKLGAPTTPLHLACEMSDIETVQECIKYGGKTALRQKDGDGRYPVDCTRNSSVTKYLRNTSK